MPVPRTLGPLLGLALLAPTLRAQTQAEVEFFENRIRPVLAEKCFKCHGPKRQRSDLRVDSLAALLGGGERGPAVVPGDLEASLLIRALRYDDEDLVMPPRGKLADEVLADFEAWVTGGAVVPASFGGDDAPQAVSEESDFDLAARAEHWSFRPIANPAPPAVRDAPWARGDVDRFVLARLEAEGLTPAPEADRRTLLRRLSFDLRGLPPTREELAEFLEDDAEDAYERWVDRFLASPHYGETWARHWLDLVRYAESKGHEFDHTIPNAHEYRDYVIRALNADVPYDRFLTEHVAGDLIPTPRPHPEEGWDESVLGTGFWYLGEEVHSPVDIRGDQVERVANQVDVFSKAFLGLTVACARCHDHKFDPITQADYYALSGYLLSSGYRQVRFETGAAEARAAGELELQRHRVEGDARLRTALALEALPGPLLSLADDAELDRAGDDPLHPLFPLARTRGTSDGFTQALGGVLEAWQSLEARSYAFLDAAQPILDFGAAGPLGHTPWIVDGPIFGRGPVSAGGVRVGLEPAPHVQRVFAYPAAAYDPAHDGLTLAAGVEREPSELRWVQSGRTLRTPTFTLEQPKVYYLVRGSLRAFAVVDGHRMVKGPLHQRVLLRSDADHDRLRWVEHDLADYVGHAMHIELSPGAEGEANPELELLMVVAADGPPPAPELPPRDLWRDLAQGRIHSPEDLAAALEDRLGRALAFLRDGRAPVGDSPRELARLARWLVARLPAPASTPSAAARPGRTAPAMLDGSAFDEWLLIRGSHLAPGDRIPRRFLEVLGGEVAPAGGGSGRLDLARRLTDPSNPLVARVQVNRLWKHLFGRGLVASVDNFGLSGEAPSHPELLDHLATRFARSGWSNKALIRDLVLSSAYRMSSQRDPQAEEHDPLNRWLHRASVRRLQAEAVRDAILAVSGRLDASLFGRPVPIHLTPFLDGRGRPQTGPLDGDGRRSIYLGVRRNFLSPFLLSFDFPTPATTIGRRSVSNVPAQALTLMNDPLVVGEARRWAERVAAEDGSVDQRIEGMYLAAFSRPPAADELAAAAEHLRDQAQAGYDSDRPEAWQDLAHVLFNVKEFVFLR